MLNYRLERNRSGGAWDTLMVWSSPSHPGSLGLIGQKSERVRWQCKDSANGQWVTVEVWEWSERVPLNPADIQCTDFIAGWKLVDRGRPPTPSADELAHFYLAP